MSTNVEADPRPLYRRVVDDIAAKIGVGAWRAGEKLPSERTLCEHYKVSQITVRRALRELTHMGLVYSHHGLGWFASVEPPRAVPPKEVVLVVSDLDWMTVALLRSLSAGLEENGAVLRLAFAEGQAEPESGIPNGNALRAAQALLLTVYGQARDLRERYRRLIEGLSQPVLLLLRDIPGTQIPAAALDESHCMQEVTRHLLHLGHRRVAYAGLDPSTLEGQRRYAGFAAALWEQGLELPLEWVFAGGLTNAQATRFRRVFAGPTRPTALVCASDMQAAQAMALLHSLEMQIPEDVAIASFGDQDLAPLLPVPLTSFHPDLQGLGRGAADMALDLLAGRKVQGATFTGQLLVRQSCGAHRGSAA